MSRTQQMIALVIATPGLTGQEIAALLGLTTRDAIKSMTTQLSQLCKAQKLRKDSILTGSVSRPRYWPTELSTVDRRRCAEHHATRSAAAKRAAVGRPQNMPGARHASRARATMRATIAAEARAKPKPAKVETPRFIKPARISTPRPHNAPSVEEFIKRGGRIDYLPQHASSNPLQFDHSATDVPIHNRRQATRVRPAPGR